ncbi:hypothetical protein FVQ98_16830 [Ottowia sp. GY511]|uniref:Uncharacterized protein n=1 Tax=Ottowia flava TaxID=2675430 RepID=A0ABW4KR53_9BURK|nr:hypothetical protein [Ottowia sp. GY511]TXK23472.1 hypothetical protein FVQ98_16830 [Ottowia sp. GY511]
MKKATACGCRGGLGFGGSQRAQLVDRTQVQVLFARVIAQDGAHCGDGRGQAAAWMLHDAPHLCDATLILVDIKHAFPHHFPEHEFALVRNQPTITSNERVPTAQNLIGSA